MAKRQWISLKKLGTEGLMTITSASLISAEATPEAYNVIGNIAGQIEVRPYGIELVGDCVEGVQVLGQKEIEVCDRCETCPPDACAAKTWVPPQSCCHKAIVKFVATRDGKTEGYIKRDDSDKWCKFDEFDCVHQMEFEWDDCKIYYSNGFNPLRIACFSCDEEADCKIKFNVYQPRCSTEYCSYVGSPVVFSDTGCMTFVDVPCACMPTDLVAGLTNGSITEITVYQYDNATLEYDPCDINADGIPKATSEYVLSGLSINPDVCNQICVTNTNNPVKDPITSFFWVKYEVGGNQIIWQPEKCSSCSQDLLADQVYGYIVKKFKDRIYVAGDLRPGLQATVYYSKKRAWHYANWVSSAPAGYGDFTFDPTRQLCSDGGMIKLNETGGAVTALVQSGNAFFAHYEGVDGTRIYNLAEECSASANGLLVGGVSATPVVTDNATNWFRNVVSRDNLQDFIESYYTQNSGRSYGLFQNFASATVQDVTSKIRPTMEKLNFEQGAASYFNHSVWYAAALDDCCTYSGEIVLENESCNNGCVSNKLIYNNVVLVRDLDLNAFFLLKDLYVSNWATSTLGQLVGSSISGNSYVLKEQNHDEDCTEGLCIQSYYSFKSFDFDEPTTSKMLHTITLSGYVSTGTAIQIGLEFDCSTTKTVTINADDVWDSGCEGSLCKGKFGSKYFQISIDVNSTPFKSVRPFVSSECGYWALNGMAFNVEAVEDSCNPTLKQSTRTCFK